MRLSKRIHDIANMVEAGESVADIGTDHAYVPMLLVKSGTTNKVIMSDISEGSLAKAIETFKKSGIEVDNDCFRIADGLDGINTSEVDDIIIAGLGGFTIIDILNKDINKSKSFKKLILQPRKFSGNLRYFLYTNGWDIIQEKLSPEGKFVCEIITAIPSNENTRVELYEEDDIKWKYPESFKYVDQILLNKRLDWKLGSIDDEINNLKKSNADASSAINKLEADKEYLLKLLNN